MNFSLDQAALFVPSFEIERRVRSVQDLFAQNGFDAGLLFQNLDRFYYSGTMQPGMLYLPVQEEPLLLIRKNLERAEEESSLSAIRPLKSLSGLGPLLAENGYGPPALLGLELDILPAHLYLQLTHIFPNSRLLDASSTLRRCRMIKSPWEIDNLTRAADLTAGLMARVPEVLRSGMSELELAGRLEAYLRREGHQGYIRTRGFNQEVFYGHILSGPEGTRASYIDSPSGGLGIGPAFSQGAGFKKLRAHEPISIDYCGCFNGYIVDQTRMVSLGEPAAAVRKAYDAMREVQEILKSRTRPGITGTEVYRWALEEAARLGYRETFMGSGTSRAAYVGHGVGLELDELPLLAETFDWPLEESMVLALEPKVILPEHGLVGIENTFLLTSGGLVPLTRAPEDFLLL
ncbi:MAG: Xaa-Pro peptidase family protein [Desulfobacterota bacterium]|jgi:Xaa-Pro dipeptidase|nr:Xaa-Pro peptidase family protein [Thermodesulfobacteriota bacterium]